MVRIYSSRGWAIIAGVAALAALVVVACRPTKSTPEALRSGDFPVAEVFRHFYASHGGRPIFGPAISQLIEEQGIQVQYTMAARLEHHPANPAGSQVILTALGLELGFGQPAIPTPQGNLNWFGPTGHTLYPEFERLFSQLGGIRLLGYPISEVSIEGENLIQYFERGAILKPQSSPWRRDVRLAALGYTAYSGKADLTKEFFTRDVPPPDISKVETFHQPFSPFLEKHQATGVLGAPLSEAYVTEDGQREQVYENGVVFADPGAPGGARLRPLGLQHSPGSSPAPRIDGALYFQETQHNVQFGFADFFQAHGGKDFFGLPLGEQSLDVDRNVLVQYFENIRLEWHFDAPTGQKLQVAPFGREVLPAPASPTATQTPVSGGPITLETWVESDVLALGSLQTIHIRALGAARAPVAGAEALLSVKQPYGGFAVSMDTTDSTGHSQLTFRPDEAKAGDQVPFEVAVIAPGFLPGYIQGSFVIWYGDGQP